MHRDRDRVARHRSEADAAKLPDYLRTFPTRACLHIGRLARANRVLATAWVRWRAIAVEETMASPAFSELHVDFRAVRRQSGSPISARRMDPDKDSQRRPDGSLFAHYIT